MAIIEIPGLIDVHTHLRTPGWEYKENPISGTKAAIAGGVVAILEMPNTPKATITPQNLDLKIAAFSGKTFCDVGFIVGGSPVSVPHLEELEPRVYALKVYMNHTTGDLLVKDDRDLEAIFYAWPNGKPIIVHAEGEADVEGEEPSLDKAIRLATEHNQRLHIAHVSLEKEMVAIMAAKRAAKIDITCEVTPHHLFLTDADARRLGPLGLMKPNLATAQDVKALWANLDWIDTIATDHAPHTLAEKLMIASPPYGVPGLETTLPLMLDAVNSGRLSLQRMINMTSHFPRLIFDIPYPENTFITVNTEATYTIDNTHIYSKAGWTPFQGRRVTGQLLSVTLRGERIFYNSHFLQETGSGKILS